MLNTKSISKLYNWRCLFSRSRRIPRWRRDVQSGNAKRIRWGYSFVSQCFITDKTTTTSYFELKKKRIYLFKGFSPTIFTSALPFVCFVLLLRVEWTEIISPLRQNGNEWRKRHSVEIRLIFFFIRISTIYRLIYSLSRYESLHFPFRSLSHLQLFRIGALSPI